MSVRHQQQLFHFSPTMKLHQYSTFIISYILITPTVILFVQAQMPVASNCEPPYAETPSFMTALKTIVDYGSTKWADRPPTREELPKVIEFWCIKPKETQFKQMFIDRKMELNVPVAFIVHGYFGSIQDSGWLLPTAKSWIAHENRAVCIVDWRELAIGTYCTASKRNVKIVASFLREMIQKQGIKPNETVLMGHSLGAHVCGICGHELKGEIKIIYGLDPAGPQFTFPSIVNASDRLDPSDARHVQCLHTNRGVAGTFFACGDSDYYANFGYRQSRCTTIGCSHVRAAYLFEVSLNALNIFKGQECGDDVRAMLRQCNQFFDRLGIHGNHYSGQYYFETADCYPYLLNK